MLASVKSEKKGYLVSPFKVPFGTVIEAYKNVKGKSYEYADTQSGEVKLFEEVSRNKRVMVDKGKYVKVFKGNNEVLFRLSDNSKSVFLYIMLHLGIHTDIIVLDLETVCGVCGFKRDSFVRSVKELSEKGIIALKKGSSIEYFVNPNYIFNGSRLKL
jgi:hypothetical protein